MAATPLPTRLTGWLLDLPVGSDADTADPAERRNGLRQVLAMSLQKAGDLVVDPKALLAWLLTSLGAPAAMTGLLVPIRESGSLLPQAALVPLVQRRAVRKGLWVAGALGQAGAVAAMALMAAVLRGPVAGVGILAALGVFALARSVSSLASKDVLGRTVAAGRRGRITGAATVASGLIAISLGLALQRWGGADERPMTLALLLGAAALAWVLAAAVFARIEESPGAHDPSAGGPTTGRVLTLLRDDAAFRRFVVARTLLLVSALSPPFVVAIATRTGGGGLAGLGPFVLASGVAALLGGRAWGRLADHSSRLTMVTASGAAAGIVLALLGALRVEALATQVWLAPTAFLLLALAHTGARVGRKTYIVDLAEGDRRTELVAVSNAAMGALLLVTGAVSSALALLGPEAALLFLAALGALGVPVGLRLAPTGAERDR